MRLTARLALSQIKTQKNRSAMTVAGIALSSAMLTAVCGFVASAEAMIARVVGYNYTNAFYNSALIGMGVILGVIIIAASVIVVSNAFRVSAGERTRQFGILKSVGATKKQISASVLYEGVFLSAIGIPIGIGIGLLLELLGTSVITRLLTALSASGTMNVNSDEFLNVAFTVTPVMFIVAICVSFATVILSAWLPARKAAKIPAIDAIRSAGEVALKRRGVKTSRLTARLFGFEGALAAKSLKRSRRAFRATVVSLTISIIMLIAASGFGTLMMRTTSLMFPDVNATAIVDWSTNLSYTYGDNGEIISLDYAPIGVETANAAAERLRAYGGAEIFGVGGISRYNIDLPDGTHIIGAALLTVDSKHYAELCERANVPVGSTLLVNMWTRTPDGKRAEYKPYELSELKGRTIRFDIDAGFPFAETIEKPDPVDVTIDGELTGEDVPIEILNTFESNFTVIVPEGDSIVYAWYANVGDVAGFATHAEAVVDELLPKASAGAWAGGSVIDIADATAQIKYMINTIMFFVYGFTGMLALIAVTGAVSTISTNVRSRAREFAALESVGMTKGGVRKMLNLESVMCSARSLIFGIPLGVLGAFALYKAMGIAAELPFELPLLGIAECVAGVFAVTWVTMRYAAGRLRDGSIVESIRGQE
jgi:putative ABC transport system permease protein